MTLTSNKELGMEVGLQTPIIFNRGIAAAGSPGTPGFNFNTTTALASGLPNSNLYKQQTVGFSGLGNLGVGRTNGGLVFSAANDTFNLLIRALETQGRVEVLSRPQLTLLDSQFGTFQVGQQYPRPTNTTTTVGAGVTAGVEYVNTGVTLNVVPRISREGKVLMHIQPSISSPNAQVVTIGNGFQATPIDTTGLETTVIAMDGETVILGGLISKSDTKSENKIPWFGDLPYVGAAFRYRTQNIERREILFIMTPHIIRTPAERMRVLAEEAGKMSWSLGDLKSMHGYGHEALSGISPYEQPTSSGMWCYPSGQPVVDGQLVAPMNGGMNTIPPQSGPPAGQPMPGPGVPQQLPPNGPMGAAPAMMPGGFPQTVPPQLATPNGPQQPVYVPAGSSPPPGLVPASGAIWVPNTNAPTNNNNVMKPGKAPIMPDKHQPAKEGDTKWDVFGK
ncbi:MAG: hypothetical protein U0798_19540 [Gemmataceae bacterium]